jgi:hypothetical protein
VSGSGELCDSAGCIIPISSILKVFETVGSKSGGEAEGVRSVHCREEICRKSGAPGEGEGEAERVQQLQQLQQLVSNDGGDSEGRGKAKREVSLSDTTSKIRFEPDGGNFFNRLKVCLVSDTGDADIFYSLTPVTNFEHLNQLDLDNEGEEWKEAEADAMQSKTPLNNQLKRYYAPLHFSNNTPGTVTKVRLSSMCFSRNLRASPISFSRVFSISGIQHLEWDVNTATNGFAVSADILGGSRLENKTGHFVCRVRGKSPLPSLGSCWWEVVVGDGVPEGNISANGVGVCVGLVLVPESDRKRQQWTTEQLGGNFSWVFNFSRGWTVHKGEKRAYGHKAVSINQHVGVHLDREKGNISFSIDGVNLGVAFTGIPHADVFPVVNIPIKGCVLQSGPFVSGQVAEFRGT